MKEIRADYKLKTDQAEKYKELSKELKVKCEELESKLTQFKQ